MTLIVTYITREGIVHAADSNLSDEQGPRGIGCKVFEVPRLHAGLCVSGSFRVAGERMDYWLERFLSEPAAEKDQTLAGFAEQLRRRLEREMTSNEKADGSMFHVGGYVQDRDGTHPEFYNIRNIGRIDSETGHYIDIGDTFASDEQFWIRDRNPEGANAIASGGYYVYVNGFPAGRITYLALDKELNRFFHRVWTEPAWKFREPKTLDERTSLIKLQVKAIATLFTVSDYPAPYIGGTIRAVAVAPPGAQPWLKPAPDREKGGT